jgi:hypothetical protein
MIKLPSEKLVLEFRFDSLSTKKYLRHLCGFLSFFQYKKKLKKRKRVSDEVN